MPLGGVLAVVAGVMMDVEVVKGKWCGGVSVVGVPVELGTASREAAPALTAALIP